MVATLVGMQVAGQIMGSIMGGYAKAEEYARQDMQFRNQEFQRNLEVDRANDIANQKNAQRIITNRQLAVSAGKQYQATLQDNLEGFKANQRAMFNAFAASSSGTKAALAGKNMSSSSGTGAALLRMSKQNALLSHKNLMRSKKIADRNADTQRQNVLNSRNLNMEPATHFVPGVSPAGDPDAAITAGWVGAIGAGVGAYAGSKMG